MGLMDMLEEIEIHSSNELGEGLDMFWGMEDDDESSSGSGILIGDALTRLIERKSKTKKKDLLRMDNLQRARKSVWDRHNFSRKNDDTDFLKEIEKLVSA